MSARRPLRTVVQEFRYGTSNKSQEMGLPALRIPNVIRGSVDVTDLKTVPVTDAEFERLALRDGDVLFVRTNGNPDNVGRCAVFETSVIEHAGYDARKFIYASYLIRARLDTHKVNPIALCEFMLGAEGRRQLREKCKTSAGQYNINIEGLGALSIPDFPLDDQDKFADRVKRIREQIRVNALALTHLDSLFASLQSHAFAGEL